MVGIRLSALKFCIKLPVPMVSDCGQQDASYESPLSQHWILLSLNKVHTQTGRPN